MTRLALALALALLIAPTGGCKSSSDDDGKAPAAESDPEGAPGAEPANATGGAVLDTLAAGGWTVAENVPFDDEGELPEAVASNAAPGQTALETHVLRSADDAYVQIATATFASSDDASAAAGDTLEHVVDGTRVVYVLAYGDDALAAKVAALLAP